MDESKDQVQSWLKNLERESWQLELLVSAFTIFLLVQATSAYSDYLHGFRIQYNLNSPMLNVGYIMMLILENSLLALTIFLIGHLMLRGFWIGTIGLRSVQSSVDLKMFNYSELFTNKLEQQMISLDKMVIKLDEICSVIFSFAFLVISILLSFGLFFCFFGLVGLVLSSVKTILPESWLMVHAFVVATIMALLMIGGMVYMIDYFTLGFFKKFKWFSRVYYPVYRLYHYVTLAGLSKSIYYHMIGKFSKKRIRLLYIIIALLTLSSFMFEFDQYQYYPENSGHHVMSSNHYDNQRNNQYVIAASIPSAQISGAFMPLFIRYSPEDNTLVKAKCPDFEPLKDDGFNWSLETKTDGGSFLITNPDFSKENAPKLLSCLSEVYQVIINDSIYKELNFHFYEHPDKGQKGLYTMISTDRLDVGENLLLINKSGLDTTESYAYIPFWFSK